MNSPMQSLKNPILRFAQFFGLWTAVAFMFALQWYSYDSLHGHSGPFVVYLRWNLEQWYAWLLISPLVLRLAAKRPIDPQHPLRFLPLHLLASVLFALLAVSVQSLLVVFLEPDAPPLSQFSAFLLGIRANVALLLSKDVAMGIVAYWALTGLAQTLHFYRESSNRQLRESQLEGQLAQAQLQVLEMQLHPHFLFNTLHAIGTLIHEDPESAEQMLLNLSALLRVFLEEESSQQISLRRELHLVDLYLSIQRIRFKDRLTVRLAIDSETLNCAIPSLILQPLVENAIVHGIAKNPGSDEVEISSSTRSGRLEIRISNSNSSLPGNMTADEVNWGVGLTNTMQRLRQTYNGSAQLSLRAGSPRGVICEISMPFRLALSSNTPEEELLPL
ncbi:sensor histidine kinase [Acidicapsa ligni]|uniref:sensor histidine kinase n=1 Tax=Acidicapsa ligni TaxID=542300 RepID=UPI0021DFE8BF|nr:histidine kinase [Acidicapsa ligni]